MKKLYLLHIILLLGSNISFAQIQQIELIFSSLTGNQYAQFNKVHILNKSKNCDTTLFYPDTVLIVDVNQALPENYNNFENQFHVFQNYPNPFHKKTDIITFLPQKDLLKIMIYDFMGRLIFLYEKVHEAGNHLFTFTGTTERTYILKAVCSSGIKSIVLSSTNTKKDQIPSLSYKGNKGNEPIEKDVSIKNAFVFYYGDELLYTCYKNSTTSVLMDKPIANKSYTFNFGLNVQCPGMSTIEYGGQEYNTVQIYNQCWLKENLNYDLENSWCYGNEEENCNEFGRLYDWESAIHACPQGWHLATDEEWKILEGAIDSQYGIGDPIWDQTGYRGFDVGFKLKSQNNWNGSNTSGFTVLPGGYRNQSGYFYELWTTASIWTASPSSSMAFYRILNGQLNSNGRGESTRTSGKSVRCFKNNDLGTLPILNTGIIVSVTDTSAEVHGEIVDFGTSFINEYGHCWSTNPDLTIHDFKTVFYDSSGNDILSTLNNLAPSTTYFVKVYAITESGISFGDSLIITTEPGMFGSPCPGLDTIEYAGHVYHTVQIGEQCWLQENLNVGLIINSTIDQTDNQIIEKYCFNNEPAYCDTYGGLYQWNEMMQYETDLQGICPDGWHIPDYDDWCHVTQYIDPTVDCSANGVTGTDVGERMKSVTFWYSGWAGSDRYGFKAQPGGALKQEKFIELKSSAQFWSATWYNVNNAWTREYTLTKKMYRRIQDHDDAIGIRCLKD